MPASGTVNVITAKGLSIHVHLKDASDTTTTGDVLWSDITGSSDSWLMLQSIEAIPTATGEIFRFRDYEATSSGPIFAELRAESDVTPLVIYFNPPKRCKPCFDCSTSVYTTGAFFIWNLA